MHFKRWQKAAVLVAAAAAVLSGCGDKKTQEVAKPAEQTIGIVQLVEHSALDDANRGIVDALKARGIKLAIDQQNAQADQSNLRNIAQRFVSHNYPLIFAIATPAAQTAANATTTIPIVATAVTDFAVAKLVKDNAKPGTNVTGSSDMNPIAAQIELLTQLVPGAKTVGTIYNSSEINSQFQVELAKKELAKKGIELVEATVSSVNDVQQTAQSLVGKVQAIYLPTDNVMASAMPTLYGITKEAKIPVIPGEAALLKNGALATVGIDYYTIGKLAGNMGADILEGKGKPETMPIQYQTEFTAVVNPTVAKQLGITIPEAIAKTAKTVQ